jgi:hypothetical protein
MGGGLLQLVAYGAQDMYLTGNPQITFFKVVYRRHTNFAIEAIQQTFNGTAGFGNTVNVTVSRNGDLINRTYVQVDLPALEGYNFNTPNQDRYVNYVGLKLISQVSVEIGGQQIDKHYSDWMYIWNELSLPLGKRSGYEKMVGADGDIVSSKSTLTSLSAKANKDITSLYIPLEFWFCRNVGLALPLIALQYHEVKLKIQFEDLSKCIVGKTSTTDTQFASKTFPATVWVDYIFLDTDERRRFAQLSHEYLIEQLQFTGAEALSATSGNRYRLNFNHPCKELIWVAKPEDSRTVNAWYNYTTSEATELDSSLVGANTSNIFTGVYPTGENPLTRCLLQLNGNDRFAERDGGYFNYVQPYQHHTNIPKNRGINVYSFALKPEEHQPSGTLNMSRIDTAVLSMTSTKAGTINIYAVNYNVLRIMSGMGGLAYSN